MQAVYQNPSQVEKLVKEKYAVPEYLMMENAARAMADFILNLPEIHKLVIVCGKGNNGGDGYAVARLLQNKREVSVISLEDPATEEARVQHEMCRRLNIPVNSVILGLDPGIFSKADLILDCIYGTGFHGSLIEPAATIIDLMNKSPAVKIACDIPSGLAFRADYTITMGSQKLALYSDKAKAVCGQIIKAELGIDSRKFELTENTMDTVVEPVETTAELAASIQPVAYLVEPTDLILPLRKNRAAHKGCYGHTAVFCGEKSGAAIIAATAAMNFGSGLTSLIKSTEQSDLAQFKISPSLMLSDSIPKKTTCIAAGSGFTKFSASLAEQVKQWFSTQKSPAAVFDAGMLTASEFPEFLKELNSYSEARIILTPHLAEFASLMKNLGEEVTVSSLAEDPELKIRLGKILNERFPRTSIIIKSANTFIASGMKSYIITDGPQSLAKGGSGDLLAGLTAALLAQGYTARDAAITAAEQHALIASQLGPESYALTPEKFIERIGS